MGINISRSILQSSNRSNQLKYWENFLHIPKELRNKDICLKAIRYCSSNLEHVPEHVIDKNICLEAIKINGFALQYVPKHMIDKEICMRAIKEDFDALKFVPINIMDKEICLESIKNETKYMLLSGGDTSQHGPMIKYIPPELIDDEILALIVQQNKSNIQRH